MNPVQNLSLQPNWESFQEIEDPKQQDQLVAELFLEVVKHVRRQAAVRGISAIRINYLPPHQSDRDLNKVRAQRIRRLVVQNDIPVSPLIRRKGAEHGPLYGFTVYIPDAECRVQDQAKRVACDMLDAGSTVLKLGHLDLRVRPNWADPSWQTRSFPVLDELYQTRELKDTFHQFDYRREALTEETIRELTRQAPNEWQYWPGIVWKYESNGELRLRRYEWHPGQYARQQLKDNDWHNVESLSHLADKPIDYEDCCW